MSNTGLREFFRHTALSVLGTLGVSCYILADTFFVSKGLGADGLTALNLAIPVYNFIHGTGLMLGMGGATRFSVLKSQGNKKEISRVYTNTVYAAAFFSLLFFAAGLLFSRLLALMLGADETVLEMTETYLRWLLLFAPAFIFNDVFLCFVRNDSAPKLSAAAMLTGSIANIFLDYIFIFPMGMGIFGAIFATGLSPVISMFIMLPHWLKKRHTFHFSAGRRPEAPVIGQAMALGFPSFVTQLSSGIVMIAFNGIILSLEGNTGVAAYGVVANLSLVIVAVYTGIAQGVQPLISDSYGRGDRTGIRAMLRYAMVSMAALSVLFYVLIFVFAQPIAAVFNGESNPLLQETAETGLRLYFISSVFIGYNIILAIFFTSVEKPLPAHILSLLRGLILILPAAFLFSSLWGMTGVWLACPITECFVALFGFVIERNNQGGTLHENRRKQRTSRH